MSWLQWCAILGWLAWLSWRERKNRRDIEILGRELEGYRAALRSLGDKRHKSMW